MTQQNLGPLPKGDRNDDLQHLSLKAFNAFLPVDRFLFRDERVDDKGVDGALELKVENSFTNFRAQVQLKGTDSSLENGDRSISLQVDTRNLNYLLNGPSPIYVLWVSRTNELRFLWARDERRRLETANPCWMDQETITLRFSHTLDAAALNDVHDRIMREGRLHRQMHDVLARSALAEEIVVGITPETCAITDPDEVYAFLDRSGLSAVSSGYASEVIQMYRLVNPGCVALPRIQLVMAYATMTNSEYMAAGGHINRCSVNSGQLSADDRHLLESLRVACHFHVGLIDTAEYIKATKELAKSAPPAFAFQHELEVHRKEHMTAQNREDRQLIWKGLQDIVARIIADPTVSRTLKLKARLVRLYAATYEVGSQFVSTVTHIMARKDMGLRIDTPELIDAANNLFTPTKELTKESEALVRETVLVCPLLFAEALVTQAVIVIYGEANNRFLLTTNGDEPVRITDDGFEQIRKRLEHAAEIFERAGSLELEIWAKLYLADWSDVAGRTPEGRRIAESVYPSAVAMGFREQISRAKGHLSGETEFRKTMAHLQMDPDKKWAEADDEYLMRCAEKSFAVMELPKERLSVVQNVWLAIRGVARERVRWCRHLEMIDDNRHSASPLTMYASDPPRRCICQKLGHASQFPSVDWGIVILAFKNAYCTNCDVREPKDKSN